MAAQGAPQQQPRALVLSSLDRDVVIRRLARAVLKFQDEFLERDSSPAGLLCQVSAGLLVWPSALRTAAGPGLLVLHLPQ